PRPPNAERAPRSTFGWGERVPSIEPFSPPPSRPALARRAFSHEALLPAPSSPRFSTSAPVASRGAPPGKPRALRCRAHDAAAARARVPRRARARLPVPLRVRRPAAPPRRGGDHAGGVGERRQRLRPDPALLSLRAAL